MVTVLAGLDRLDLLGQCFERVLMPSAVYQEWLAGDASVSECLAEKGFLEVGRVEDSPLLDGLRSLLDPGEAEALALARERSLPLLVDEKKGRSIARLIKSPVLGLVGVLILAVERDILMPHEAVDILHQAKERGFRVSSPIFHAFLTRLGVAGGLSGSSGATAGASPSSMCLRRSSCSTTASATTCCVTSGQGLIDPPIPRAEAQVGQGAIDKHELRR